MKEAWGEIVIGSSTTLCEPTNAVIKSVAKVNGSYVPFVHIKVIGWEYLIVQGINFVTFLCDIGKQDVLENGFRNDSYTQRRILEFTPESLLLIGKIRPCGHYCSILAGGYK